MQKKKNFFKKHYAPLKKVKKTEKCPQNLSVKKQKSDKCPKKRYDPSKKKVKSPQKALQTCSDLGMRVKFQTEKFKNG